MNYETDHKYKPSGYSTSNGVALDSCLQCGKTKAVHIELKALPAHQFIDKSRWQAHCQFCGRSFESLFPEQAKLLVIEHENKCHLG